MEAPIQRRSLKAPLPLREEDLHTETEAVEEVSFTEEVAMEEPDTWDEPEAVEEVAAASGQEMSMFDVPNFDQNDAVAEEDTLPEPAYRPQEVAENIEHPIEESNVQEIQPSEATYRRLHEAVEKQPEVDPRDALRSFARAEQEPKRGVLGGFISRMTGGSQEDAYSDAREEPSFRDQVESMDPEDDQVGVPAFLRRQAN